MGVLIDASVLIGHERGRVNLEPHLAGREDEEFFLSVVTASELLHGVHRAQGAIRVRRHAFVEHVLAGIDAIPITDPVARVHAGIWAELSNRGQPIGAHDLWIAATALAHGLGVATRNATHFTRIEGLRVVAPLD